MVDYRPRAGDKMLFFLSAGNARKGSAGPEADVTSVRERSNVVMVTLPAGDDGMFAFAPAPVVATTQPPLSPTTHAIDLDIVLEEIHKLDAKIQILTDAVSALRSSVA